ncbi:putative cyclin-A3-1 [Tripterygium wilfordii]|uniref:Putative cyclin-A3-1 n=1 Tax=Tripterygium wilfordii TaxID=458696 RepID=A0A7J7D2T7_TRIWF|nr:putative cyclin-A3-1 [Tripterygium wilfordii]
MADQENVRITRTAKRRAAGNTEDMPVPKKRVVLGELPNVSNVVVSVNPSLGNEPQKRKSRAKTKAKKALVSTTAKSTTEDVAEKVDIDGESHDPQMCAPYATDIYDYLHKMELGCYILSMHISCNLCFDVILKRGLYCSISFCSIRCIMHKSSPESSIPQL